MSEKTNVKRFCPESIRRAVIEFTGTFRENVIYESDEVVVVNKPAGLTCAGMGPYFDMGVKEVVGEFIEGENISPVHQLDVNTSGVLILGKDPKARADLTKQWMARSISKEYYALVTGVYPGSIAGILAPIYPEKVKGEGTYQRVGISEGAKIAATRVKVIGNCIIESGQTVSLVRVDILTGRTHQIRTHLASIGYPIVGDGRYNPKPGNFERPFLHCRRISIAHPGTGETLNLIARLPEDFRQVVPMLVSSYS